MQNVEIKVSVHNTDKIEGYVRQGAHITYDKLQYGNLLAKRDARQKVEADVRKQVNSVASFFKFFVCGWRETDHERHKWYKQTKLAANHERESAKFLVNRARNAEKRALKFRVAKMKAATVFREAWDIPTIFLCYPRIEDS